MVRMRLAFGTVYKAQQDLDVQWEPSLMEKAGNGMAGLGMGFTACIWQSWWKIAWRMYRVGAPKMRKMGRAQ